MKTELHRAGTRKPGKRGPYVRAALGLAAGALVAHPLSMVLEGLVHPRPVIDPLRMASALSPHHALMALGFGLLGMALFVIADSGTPATARPEANNSRGRMRELLPICAWCKKIRDDSGRAHGTGDWHAVEEFLSESSGAELTHGICPECLERISREMDAPV